MSSFVVCIGTATLDTIALVEHFPDRDSRAEAKELLTAGGGQAATAAVALARLGHSVALVSTVGRDEAGDRVLDGLASEGVDVTAVSRQGDRTAASIILVEEIGQTRTIVNRPGPQPHWTEATSRVVQAADWVHIDHAGYQTWRERGAVESAAARVSLDQGNPIRDLDLSAIQLFVPTEQRLLERYPGVDLTTALQRARAEGPEIVVATRGAAGSMAAAQDGIHAVPGVPTKAVSTLGAGDVFHGALLAALCFGHPVEDALRWANTAAALSCRAIDGRSAIPSLPELTERITTLTGSVPHA